MIYTTRHRLGVQNCLLVQFPEINDRSESTSFFLTRCNGEEYGKLVLSMTHSLSISCTSISTAVSDCKVVGTAGSAQALHQATGFLADLNQ